MCFSSKSGGARQQDGKDFSGKPLVPLVEVPTRDQRPNTPATDGFSTQTDPLGQQQLGSAGGGY